MSRRTFGAFLALGLSLISAQAQSYQTNFSEVKYDRANGPSTWHGGVEIDAATGAASVSFPLGPGIGARGAMFNPVLSGRWSPQIKCSTRQLIAPPGQYSFIDIWRLMDTGGFTLERGNLVLSPSSASAGGRLNSDNFTLPSGASGSIADSVLIGAGSVNEADASTLLGRFPGFAAGSFQMARNPYFVELNTTPPDPATLPAMIRSAQGGFLVLGVNDAAHPQTIVGTVHTTIGSLTVDSDGHLYIPGKVILIQGTTAYEFCQVGTLYGPKVGVTGDPGTKFNDPSNPGTRMAIDSAFLGMRYELTRIMNRHGDEVLLTSGPGGYSVTWKSSGTLMPASLQVVKTAVGGSGAMNVTVTYSGVGNAPAYTITNMRDSMPQQLSPQGRNPDTITYLVDGLSSAGGETASFTYTGISGPWTSYTEDGLDNPMQCLASLTYNNGRSIGLSWAPYSYRRNNTSFPGWWGYHQDHEMNSARTSYLPQFMVGVNRVDDVTPEQTRTTRHLRRVPQPDLVAPVSAYAWVSTAFDDGVVRPDGTVAATRYVEPLVGTSGAPTEDADLNHQLQTLAHLKHQVREIREYVTEALWMADRDSGYQTPSNAYKITASDRWTLRNPGNVTGDISTSAIPFPTRNRTWVQQDHLLTQQEARDWNATDAGWSNQWKWVADAVTPSLGMDIRSLAEDGSLSLSDPTNTVYKTVQATTFSTIWKEWLLARPATEQVTITDNTAGHEPSDPQPSVQPMKTTTFDATAGLQDRVSSIQLTSGSTWVKTGFTYWDDVLGSLKSTQLKTATLTGQDASGALADSGNIGISQFDYDATLGYLNSIKQLGVTWAVTQKEDALHRPIEQGDPAGLITKFDWDASGRLLSITPPGSTSENVPTTLTYDVPSSQTGVARGLLTTQNQYSGFGQPVLERRQDSTGWSNRMVAYDLMGHPIQTSVWSRAAGLASNWSQDLTTLGYAVTATTYDPQGRVTKVVDPNGITVTTSYDTLKKTVTRGTSITIFETDQVGRLYRVTDAKNQVTRYYYDAANRIRTVRQWPGAETTTPQVRTWAYNPLGWLTTLTQPESGTTQYAQFTVQGKPKQTTYGAGSASPKVVTTTYDQIGRVRAVDAPAYGQAPLLKQRFDYDPAGIPAAQGKLSHSSDGPDGAAISRDLTYDPHTGRVTDLSTTLPMTSMPLIQHFHYDAYGHRDSGTLDGRPWTQPYDLYRDLPTGGLIHFGQSVAPTLIYNDGPWNLQQINFGNGTKTSYSYDPDQVRLRGMMHFLPGTNPPLANWTYNYDDRGNLQSVADTVTVKTEQFLYDALDRLTQAWVWNPLTNSSLPNQGLVQEFNYDAFGNRTLGLSRRATDWTGTAPVSAKVGQPLLSSGYPAVPSNTIPVQDVTLDTSAGTSLSLFNQLPATANGSAPTGAIYDAQGNLTQVYAKVGDSSSMLSLTYDPLGRVSSMYNAATGTSEVYTYSPEGLRTVVQVYLGQVLQKTKVNLYNDQRQLVSQYVWE